MRVINMFLRQQIDAHSFLGVLYVLMFAASLILEYGFGLHGCLFCWVQRWWLLIMGVFLLRKVSWRWVMVMALLSCMLGLFQISMVLGSTSCGFWGGFLPATVFSWLMQFPQCDLSGFWNIPWAVWLLFYQAMVLGYCLRRGVNESAI